MPAADHLGRLVSEVVPNIWPQIEPIYRSIASGKGPTADHEIVGDKSLLGRDKFAPGW